MASITMTKKELISIKNELKNRKEKLDKKNNDEFSAKTITLNAHIEGQNEIQKLDNELAVLNVKLLTKNFELITLPGAEIKASINKLDEAINDIQNLRKLLNTVTEVIKAVNTVIGIVSTL
ncbi:hypothetical protein [Aphanothece sacrum]|uniref:Seryl-tRNA synthetase n=1 Tax=Aphanothece sacrum FPU1 TaxID=1920663 RepID=A0A401IBM4_APHSA|nr:hypothetical protein [Aphanothece sacrum]GBF78624.1 seryl-tRNA synthetase [Aphanothece sacrum FPU1]GBF84865.1 seryl-tRNA synthetase [Aphanothece sacrum FPU3]